MDRKGFTLIELLIVVAIIAILAAIAIPNFLAAQTRSKVSRIQKDMQTVATALEAYYVDNNDYLPCFEYGKGYTYNIVPHDIRLVRLSTPIAYLSSIPKDTFQEARRAYTDPAYVNVTKERQFDYWYWDAKLYGAATRHHEIYGGPLVWQLRSVGPNGRFDAPYETRGVQVWYLSTSVYDPTNGVVSPGDIWRVGP